MPYGRTESRVHTLRQTKKLTTMTRKEAKEALHDIRGGLSVEMEDKNGNSVTAYLYESWRDYKDYIGFDGYGSWACKNTLADFYDHVKDYKLR